MVASLIQNTTLFNYLSKTQGVERNIKGHYVFVAGRVYNFDQGSMEGTALIMIQQKMLVDGTNLTFIIND